MAESETSERRSTRDQLEQRLFSPNSIKERKEFWEKFIEKWENRCKDVPFQFQRSYSMDDLGEDDMSYTDFQWEQLDELKTFLFKRNESRLLQDGFYDMWSQKLWQVASTCRSFMSKEKLKKFLRNCISNDNLPKIKEKLKEHESTLGDKLILRVEKKQKDMKYDFLNSEIRKEWNRLLKVLPIEDLVIYSLEVLKKNRLERAESQKKDQVENTPDSMRDKSYEESNPITKQKPSKTPQLKYGSIRKNDVGNLDVKENKKLPKLSSHRRKNYCDKGTQHFQSSKIQKRLFIN